MVLCQGEHLLSIWYENSASNMCSWLVFIEIVACSQSNLQLCWRLHDTITMQVKNGHVRTSSCYFGDVRKHS